MLIQLHLQILLFVLQLCNYWCVKPCPHYKCVCTSLQQRLVSNGFLYPHWHSAEPAPHLPSWGELIGWADNWFASTLYRKGTLYFSCAILFSCGRELLVANLLIAHINNKATGMLYKLSHLKSTLLTVSGGMHWNGTRCSADALNPFQTQVKPALACSVDRPLL